MGVLAAEIFRQAGASFGLLGKMKLASLARLTSTEASAVEDTPELVGRLEDALRQLRGEEEALPAGEATVVAPKASADEAGTLRRHLSACVDLLGQRSLFLGDLGATARRITESAATTLDVARASVWLLEAEGTRIRCVDLFDRTVGEHAAGTELGADDYGPYFDALRTERTIAAHDAHGDPRTSCFSAGYLGPLGITALLDVPIWRAGTMVGVLCHEHTLTPRRWNSDEETFAYLLASFVALSLERGSADEPAGTKPPELPPESLALGKDLPRPPLHCGVAPARCFRSPARRGGSRPSRHEARCFACPSSRYKGSSGTFPRFSGAAPIARSRRPRDRRERLGRFGRGRGVSHAIASAVAPRPVDHGRHAARGKTGGRRSRRRTHHEPVSREQGRRGVHAEGGKRARRHPTTVGALTEFPRAQAVILAEIGLGEGVRASPETSSSLEETMAKPLGEVCAGAGECESNACADGVCCDRACLGGCERCDRTGTVGTCVVTGDASRCGIRCIDAFLFQSLRCDGQSAECQAGNDGGASCGQAGCVVLPSGKSICAACSDTVPCLETSFVCREGQCVDGSPKPPEPSSCQADTDCGSPDLVCAAERCEPRGTPSAFASIEPLPLDESCSCRVPGASSPDAAPSFWLAVVPALVLFRLRARTRRALFAGLGLALVCSAWGLAACSPQEDLPANQACLDTPIALSAVVLACTDDYDAARRVGNGFEGKYRCNATDVAETPRYYRCPAELRALPCGDVKAAGEDYEQLLGRSNACRLLFSHPDGSSIPPSPDGSGGGAGSSGADSGGAGGMDVSGQAGNAGSSS